MSTSEDLLAEFEKQAPLTRKFLERLPEDQLLWKPQPRSLTAGQLALHLATVPGGVANGAKQDTIAPLPFFAAQPESLKQVLNAFEESIATVRSVIPTFDEAAMHAPWSIVDEGKVIATMPRRVLLRDIMLSHWYQHRGQFSVFPRLLGRPVPATWGPSPDEQPASAPSK
jgi:uncharacterized damage-inducible protein DinB